MAEIVAYLARKERRRGKEKGKGERAMYIERDGRERNRERR